MKDGMVYTEEVIPQTEPFIPLGSILQSEVEEKYYLSETSIEKFRYLKGPKRIERTSATGHSYFFSEGGWLSLMLLISLEELC